MNNITLFQFFHWYTSFDENLWRKAAAEAPRLKAAGVSHVWLPPAYKSAYGASEPGYAVYDLYDLGEFDQKGSVRTKYGTKEEYLECIKAFHDHQIGVLADIVLNHKLGGDEKEQVPVRRADPENRLEIAPEEEIIEAWTKFYFPQRQGKYSSYVWDWHSFTGVSEDSQNIYLIQNEHSNGQWEEMLEEEKGNYDYLMGADIEFRNPHVIEELKKWGEWYIATTHIDGFRLDAVKHINPQFYNEWLDHLKAHFAKEFLCVGEYWRSNLAPLLKYIEATEGRVQLFDVPLHFNFHHASVSGPDYDMRRILDNSLVQSAPTLSVTFVDNHDTQPLQSLQSPVDQWFKPLAYAIILLRIDGLPCIFFPAYYGARYMEKKDDQDIKVELQRVEQLPAMMRVRQLMAYGPQRDYFDHANTIGWTREGLDEQEFSGLAVVLTNGTAGDKRMEIGKRHSGARFVDITGHSTNIAEIDAEGFGQFFVGDRSVSVWIREEAIHLIKENE